MEVLLLVLSNAYSMESVRRPKSLIFPSREGARFGMVDGSPEVYKAIKGPVLLTIAGAYGLSTALRATGIAMWRGMDACQLPKTCALPVCKSI